MADNTAPCLTPLLRRNLRDLQPFHLTSADCSWYITRRSLIKMGGIDVNISFLNRTECLILSNALVMSITHVKTSEPLLTKCEWSLLKATYTLFQNLLLGNQIEDHLSEDDDRKAVS